MNAAPGHRHEVTVQPRGPLAMRGPRGEVPLGHAPLAGGWTARLPESFALDGIRIRGERIVIEGSDPDAIASARDRITRFWAAAIAPLWPDPLCIAPVSAAGLVGAATLAVPVGGVGGSGGSGGLAARLDAYLAARVARSAPFGVPATADRILRLVALLDVPATLRAVLDLSRGDHWTLDIVESGPLEALRARMVPATGDAKAPGCALEVFHRQANLRPAEMFSVARAVQMAWLVAAGAEALPAALDIAVRHPGHAGLQLALHLRRQDWGLGLLRLSRAVREDLAGRESLPKLADLAGLGLRVRVEHAPGAPTPGRVLAAPPPLRWQAERAGDLPGWTYSGDGGVDNAALAHLPFAVVPAADGLALALAGRKGFPHLPAEERQACLGWLSGPRGAEGFRPAFGRLYLEGLEYRLLADGAPQAEAAALSAEIARIGRLAPAGDPLAAAAAALVDWLGATGRRPIGPLAEEGPLSRLTDTGRRVLEGAALTGPDLRALEDILFPDPAPAEAFLRACRDLHPGGLVLRPVRVGLRASYRSLCGLCDRQFHVFRQGQRALPDLRRDLALRSAIEGLREHRTTGEEA